MNIVSLFSGVGGLEKGLVSGLGGHGEVVAQVEFDAYCRNVLARHYPDVDRAVEDVRQFTKWNWRGPDVDLICGGFPCQSVSSAGKGAGLADKDKSGLWYEYLRIVTEFKPPWVVVENVASGKRRWLPHVRRDLHLLGYRTRAFQVSAFDVGAPHRRERVFVLAADPERIELREQQGWRGGTSGQGAIQSEFDGPQGIVADPYGEGELQQGGIVSSKWRWSRDSSGAWSFEPGVRRDDDGLSTWVDVAPIALKVENRQQRLKALGNSVVPAQAEVIGRIIHEHIRQPVRPRRR